jgi:hypothetical protein
MRWLEVLRAVRERRLWAIGPRTRGRFMTEVEGGIFGLDEGPCCSFLDFVRKNVFRR